MLKSFYNIVTLKCSKIDLRKQIKFICNVTLTKIFSLSSMVSLVL